MHISDVKCSHQNKTEGGEDMKKPNAITANDIEEGKFFMKVFESLSPEAKLQAQAYLSALRDKEEAEMSKKAG